MSEPRLPTEDHLTELGKQNGIYSAFPNPQEQRADGEILSWATPGLSKRELFAAMVMQGLAADPGSNEVSVEGNASTAVKWAEALLKELAK